MRVRVPFHAAFLRAVLHRVLRTRKATALAAVTLVVGGGLIATDYAGRPPTPPMPHDSAALPVRPVRPSSSPPTGPAALPASADHAMLATRSVPTRVDIPAIDVRARLVPVGVASDGAIALPPADQPHLAGWYELGVSPGERGRSVIVGHLDSRYSGPAVFYRLGALRPGDMITVLRRDGVRATFSVDATALHPRNDFPAAAVHGLGPRPELRLITCGGRYDSQRGWTHNIIVSAHLVS